MTPLVSFPSPFLKDLEEFMPKKAFITHLIGFPLSAFEEKEFKRKSRFLEAYAFNII